MAIVNYSIGDVHGKITMLDALLDDIDSDIARNYTIEDEIKIIFVGDYVDRGEASKQVIKRIRNYTDYPVVALYGNHEDMMLYSLRQSQVQEASLRNWVSKSNGGFETLLSYGMPVDELKEAIRQNSVIRLRAMVGDDLQWLETLPVTYETELAIYVHACLEPDKPLNEQHPDICIWSRSQKFLSGMFDLGKPVVHGHTIQRVPARLGGRIGIDTGACAGGRLSALVLDSNGREEFLQVNP